MNPPQSKEAINFIKEGLVFIDFYADWCMPCMMMVPIVDELCVKFKDKIKFGKVDVGENQTIAAKFNVSSIPNMTLLRDGQIVEQIIGSISEEDLAKVLEGYLK